MEHPSSGILGHGINAEDDGEEVTDGVDEGATIVASDGVMDGIAEGESIGICISHAQGTSTKDGNTISHISKLT